MPISGLPYHYALRKEAVELWEYHRSDERINIVQIGEMGDDAFPIVPELNVNKGLLWIEAHIWPLGDRISHYCVIIDPLEFNWSKTRRKRSLDDGTVKSDMPMLHNVPEFIQPPKVMHLKVLPSMIRLKRLHYGDCIIGNPECLSSKLHLCVNRVLGNDGKADISGRLISSKQCKLPSEIIQCRSHTGNSIPEYQPALRGRTQNGDLDDVLLGLKIVLSGNSLGVRFDEDFANRFERL